MTRRFFRNLPRRTLHVVGALLLLGVVTFFALTRTEVGRRQLKKQIEAQFDERFAGELQIGQLTGNLVGTVYARDVQIRAPGGEAVLTADSVRAAPHWRSLLRRAVTFGQIELTRPRLHLKRSAGGAWNVARAFRRDAPRDSSTGSSPSSDPFAFRFADVVVRGGRIQTENAGARPRLVRRKWLFDYTNAQLTGVDARLSFERAAGDGLQIDLHRLRGRLAGAGVPIEAASGQLSISDGAVALRPWRLSLGKTRLSGSLVLNRRRGPHPPALRVNLAKSRLAPDEIRRLVPRWPLRAATTVALEGGGPLDDLTLRQLRIERGALTLRAKGTLRGLPDDLAFDLQFDENRLTAADLRAVLPGLPRPLLARLARFGTTRFSLDAEGRLTGLSTGSGSSTGELGLRASTQFDVQTDAGALRGTADVARRPGRPLTYDVELRAENFEADRLGETALPSSLTGTLTLKGEGASARALAGNLEARLERSVVAGRQLDGLDVTLEAASGKRLSGTATLRQRGGRLRLEGTADLSGAEPVYEFVARGNRFDLGALLDRDSLSTALTGTARVEGRGASLGALAGRLRLALDSSTVTRGGAARTLPPFASTLQLAAPGATGPRLALRGDLADLTLTGEADLAALRALGRLWGRALADAFGKAYQKPYPPRADTQPEQPPSSPPQTEARTAARQALAAADQGDAAGITADLTLKRPALLHALVPSFPALRDSLALRVDLRAGAETLRAEGALRAARLRTGRVQAAGLESTFRAQASLAAPLLETLDASFDASADTLALAGARFQAPALAASFREHTGNVQLSTSAAGGSGRLQLDAGLRLLPDRNRLLVRTLRLATGDYQWRNASERPVDLYSDAVVVPGLALVNRSAGGDRPQRVELRGTLSTAVKDTLFADASRVRLGSLSQLAGLQRPLDGRLDAQVAWTGGTRAPELTGRLDVQRLAFDRHLLGRLTAQSRFVPGSPRLAFDARLRPGGAQPPNAASPLIPEENRLAASGTVALPGLGGTAEEAGALDLALDVERADLFFFDYLFEGTITEAGGALTGEGRIGGTFRDPLFQADFQIDDGTFQVPHFGLHYDAEGDVRVDREGIKIDGARLTDPDGGRARVDGALLFNDYDYFSFDLSAALDEFQIIDVQQSPDLPFYGQIAASGPARLSGPLSDARLASKRVRTTPESELVIPIEDDGAGGADSGFLIFADSTGRLRDLQDPTRRESIFERPAGERSFADGLDLDLGIAAPAGSTVRLVFDPLLGDEITAVGGGRIQVQRDGGDLSLFGTFDVDAGQYLFTAGQVFQRRFQIESGTLQWDGSATNAQIDLDATYRTRASRAGLPDAREDAPGRIPIIVRLGIDGRVQQPSVDLSLAVDRRSERGFSDYSSAGLETILNRSDRESEYATSILLTNTFLLTTDLAGREGEQGFSATSNRLAFNSVSQLVSSQLNRYLDEALPNLDVNLGVQGENPQDLDVIYGVALRLLDERLVIRGEGVLDSKGSQEQRPSNGFEGEFVVELRLTSNVSAEAFYRREGSLLSDQALTSTTGAGFSYQTEFPTWKKLWHRLFGWLGAGPDANEEAPVPESDTVATGE